MIAFLVVLSVLAIAVPFVFYPLMLWLRATFSEEPITTADCTPSVDLIVCAHDEAASIGARIENALALDYPQHLLTIWVASDGSSDATVAIARRFEERGVRVLDLPRGGKAAALTTAVSESGEASGADVLAFSDANSMWQRGALRALVRPFSDERVGGVAGDQRYGELYVAGDGEIERRPGTDAAAVGRAHGERTYWSFDRQLKAWQSRAGSAISATGAIYAIRRTLFRAPPADATDDFMISTEVIAQGKRLVFAVDAVAIEPPADDRAGEFRRKVRIITRGLRGVAYRRALLRPSQSGIYAVELLLHKLWRRLTWIPLVVLFALIPACWSAGGVLAAFAVLLAGGLVSGLAGLAIPALARFRPVAIASYVLMVNSACAVAALNALRGHRVSRWDSERATASATGRAS